MALNTNSCVDASTIIILSASGKDTAQNVVPET